MSEAELHPELEEYVEELAEEVGQPKGAIISQLEALGLNLDDVSDEDAEEFIEAGEDGDIDRQVEILKEYGLNDEAAEELRDSMEQAKRELGDPSGNGQDPEGAGATGSGSSSGDGLTEAQRREVQEVVSQSVPTANEIAAQVSGQIDQPPAQGDQNARQSALAEAVARKFLQESGGGGGQAAEIGQQFQQAAMKNFMRKLAKPSMGEIIEMRLYEDMADEYADKYRKEFFEGDPMEELEQADDDGDDESPWWSI